MPNLIILSTFLMLFSNCIFAIDHSTEATLDLSQESWKKGQIIKLERSWAFFWQEFIEPEEVEAQLHLATRFPVPGAWNSPPDGYAAFPPVGHATYFLKILVPQNQSHFYLAIPDMASAYTLYNNGNLIAQNGIPGTHKLEEKPAYLPKQIPLNAVNGELNLVLHTSNFHYQWGGVWYPLKLSDEQGISELREKPIIQAMLSASVLLAAGLFGLYMFFRRRSEKVLLYFSLLCIAMGVRRLLIDERILYLYLDDSWRILQALENISIYLSFPFFVAYFAYRFPFKYSKQAIILSWLIAIPFCSLALTTQVSFYTSLNVTFQVCILLTLPYIFYIYVKLLREKRPGAKTFGFGLGIFILTVINDILAYSYVIDTVNLSHLGILAFVIFQGVDLAKSYLHSFNKINRLSEDLQKQNKELKKIDSFKDEFLATTSHELRTPLHGIAGLAHHLLQEPNLKLSLDNQHKLDLIYSTSKRLSSLVNDILDFSSIKHGTIVLNKKSVDLKNLSAKVMATLTPLIAGKDIRLSADINENARFVLADENRLLQILFNLLGNAIKFTESGFIQLNARLSETDQDILIEIIDTGMGIPADKYDLLFEPFQKFAEPNDTRLTGSGLGLSISQQLVSLHGGELVVASKPGQGTQIQFVLEACTAAPMSLKEQKDDSDDLALSMTLAELDANQRTQNLIEKSHWFSDNSVENESIQKQEGDNKPFKVPAIEQSLIYAVDDEHVNLELMTAQLSKANYRLDCFSSAQSMLDTLSEKAPDLILLDLMMPGMSGLEACKRIRQKFDSYEVPVMMITARYQINDIVDSLNAGANDYLVKPYHEQELLARVYSQLSARQFWFSHQENQVLKQEIDHRKQLEAQLSLANQRLLHALDLTNERILLLNTTGAVIYANESAQTLFSQNLNELLHTPIQDLLDSISIPFEQLRFEIDDSQLGKLPISVHPFEEQGEHYFAFIIHNNSDTTAIEQDLAGELISNLTQELTNNRKKIDQIEQTLKQISALSSNQQLPPTLEAKDPCDELTRRELLIRLLRDTINLWERYTLKTKADLAEESRCWRVYLDGTTAKTRTLDRYLSERTLPANPRWQLVNRTAQYVIDHCELKKEDQHHLENLIHELDQAFC